MPHLRSVYKGTFLLLREGVTSPMRADAPKITKIQELPRASSPGSPPGRCPGPTGGLEAAPSNPMTLKKIQPPRIPGSAPVNHHHHHHHHHHHIISLCTFSDHLSRKLKWAFFIEICPLSVIVVVVVVVVHAFSEGR